MSIYAASSNDFKITILCFRTGDFRDVSLSIKSGAAHQFRRNSEIDCDVQTVPFYHERLDRRRRSNGRREREKVPFEGWSALVRGDTYSRS